MKTFFYVVTFMGGILGMLILGSTILADSAPQQGAGAAVAVALVVIPYCMARAIGSEQQDRTFEELVKAVKAQSQPVPPVQSNAPVTPSPYAPPPKFHPLTGKPLP